MKHSLHYPEGFHLEPDSAALVIANEVCRPRKDSYKADIPNLQFGVEFDKDGNLLIVLEAPGLTRKIIRKRLKILLPSQIEFKRKIPKVDPAPQQLNLHDEAA